MPKVGLASMIQVISRACLLLSLVILLMTSVLGNLDLPVTFKSPQKSPTASEKPATKDKIVSDNPDLFRNSHDKNLKHEESKNVKLPPYTFDSKMTSEKFMPFDIEAKTNRISTDFYSNDHPLNSNTVSEPKKLTSNQNTVQKIDRRTVQVLEKLFLANAGLKTKPKVQSDFIVPEYMLDLYRHQSQRKDEHKNSFLLSRGKGMIAANTVRSFLHDDVKHSGCELPNCAHVSFDTKTLPQTETITGAELRIFVEPPSRSTLVNTVDKTALATTKPDPRVISHRVEVHEIMRPVTSGSEVISRLLDTKTINPGTNSTWISFDIHPAVQRWKQKGSTYNHGLEIRTISKSSNNPLISEHHKLSTDSHVRVRRAANINNKDWALKRPLLVTYTYDGTEPESTQKFRKRNRRSTRDSDSQSEEKRNRRGNRRGNRKRRRKNRHKKKRRRRKKKGNKNMCKRHTLYVNFSDVGWDDWIVAPPGYNAYYCHGDCMAPLPDYSKASNHAMLQARVYKVNPSAVPMVCCVPVKMSPISMLYLDEKGRTILKNYQDMRVEECGCK